MPALLVPWPSEAPKQQRVLGQIWLRYGSDLALVWPSSGPDIPSSLLSMSRRYKKKSRQDTLSISYKFLKLRDTLYCKALIAV